MKSKVTRPTRLSCFALVALYLFLTVKALEGPTRYMLVSADVEWAIYVPTFLLLLVVLVRGYQVWRPG